MGNANRSNCSTGSLSTGAPGGGHACGSGSFPECGPFNPWGRGSVAREHAATLFRLFYPGGKAGKFSLDRQQRAEAALSDLLVRAGVDLSEDEWDRLCGALSQTPGGHADGPTL